MDVIISEEQLIAEIPITLGIPGPKGETGDKGDQGEQGVAGEAGVAGVAGEQGIQGIQGIQGEKGDKGDNGSDASVTSESIATALGFTPIPLSSVTKSQVGLGNVDNTSDVNKPVSTAQATADTAVLNTAETYADTAKAEAISTASSDATSKSNSALTTAQSYTDTAQSYILGVVSGWIANFVSSSSLASTLASYVTSSYLFSVLSSYVTSSSLATTITNLGLGTASTHASSDFVLSSKVGAANGVASLDSNGYVPLSQIAGSVAETIFVSSYSALPTTGASNVIYITNDNNKFYRWNGSAYLEISSTAANTDALSEGSTNLYFTAARAISAVASSISSAIAALGLGTASTHAASDFDTAGAASTVQGNLNTHTGNTSNPHSVTKAQVGLGNADNTSDTNKPVSTAQATADTAVLNTAKSYTDTAQAYAIGVASSDATTKSNNAVTTSEAYTDTGLALKAPLASPALTGNPTAPTQAVTDSSTKIATTAFVKSQAVSLDDLWSYSGL